MDAISIEAVSFTIGGKEILHNVSISVEKGKIFGLIGNNGAGKTSLLRIILGLYPKYEGKIKFFDNNDIKNQRKRIGAVLDTMEPDNDCTAEEYLGNILKMLNAYNKDVTNNLLEKVGLGRKYREGKKISQYSLGMKRRLMIACALAGEPDILIMDEPFNGIDSRGMGELRLLLQMLASEGKTVLVTSHIISELVKFAGKFGVMYEGKIIKEIDTLVYSNVNIYKRVMRWSNSLALLEKLREALPDLFVMSDASNEISIYGNASKENIRLVCEMLQINENDVNSVKMTLEEMLLWRMEGYEN